MKLLGRLNRFILCLTAILLAILIWTGLKQRSLINGYNSTVEESEQAIFLYATIREQITEAVLTRDSAALLVSATEFERFNEKYTSLMDNHLIPGQYKLSFLKDLDLELTVVNLRNLAKNLSDADTDVDAISQLLNQLRHANLQFLKFDRIVVSEMKNKVVLYQKWALILMGLIIALICFTLVAIYRRSLAPLDDLADQVKSALDDGNFMTLHHSKNSSGEIRLVASAYNQLVDLQQDNGLNRPLMREREAELQVIVNEVINGLNGIINYSQILADYFDSEDIDVEIKKKLRKIIDAGEKSAAVLQNGFHLSD